ncbi:carbohydrate ABC transporter permease [Paenibacillus psychroresistens]|uniref:Carbohydrate ABC transporter permease n=1 Tax=Paenibacillus psychroresistens TaxID=1778678 RepID=A0A6B8RIH4_9BACL|nr:carbohydrate ABC transporter permease [Paenibacillus psychroresistens]QGQ95148.1 carbohydrate ABC transporter permease [Paenibacillus psychroresistens]
MRIKAHSKGDRGYLIVVYTLLIFALILVSYPVIYVISASFSSPTALISGRVILWPVEPTLMAYKAIFESNAILKGFVNSLYYTSFGTLINVTLTCLAAYPLSQKDFYGRKVLMFFMALTMLFSGGLIPIYLVVKNLGLLDSVWAMVLPGAVSAWYVIIARTFFQTSLPEELKEAADMDGCSDIRYFIRIVLPLSKPILAVLTLMFAVSHWNSYFNALIYLNKQQLYPLQIILRNILILNSANMLTSNIDVKDMITRQYLAVLLKYSVIVVASAPLLLLYPFIQKYFIKGMMLGSLKG